VTEPQHEVPSVPAPASKAIQEPASSGWRAPPTGFVGMALALIIGIVGALAVLAAWKLPPFATSVQGTEDAYVRGKTTVISPQVSGYVVKVSAADYQTIKTDDLLVLIDDKTYRQKVDQAKALVDVASANLVNNAQTVASKRAAVDAAKASVSSATAQLNNSRISLDRAKRLVGQGSGTQSELDNAQAANDVAQAAVEQANAAVETAGEDVKSAQVQGTVLQAMVESSKAEEEQAAIDLSHTEIRAPGAGQLSDIGVRVGQYVTNGSQLFFLVPDERWVVANFKEAQTAHMEVGQPAWFTVDALNRRRFSGKVEQISPAAGSEFSILRPDNATGNFTKVPQRITVRILLDPGQPQIDRLRPGMSVEAFVDTKDAKE
jgi:multidrug resistance efflux pump